jgi:hypothetical protein
VYTSAEINRLHYGPKPGADPGANLSASDAAQPLTPPPTAEPTTQFPYSFEPSDIAHDVHAAARRRAALNMSGSVEPLPPPQNATVPVSPRPAAGTASQDAGATEVPLPPQSHTEPGAQNQSTAHVQLEASSLAVGSGSAKINATVETPSPHVPDQTFAPVRIEERDGKIARASDRESALRSTEADFNAWREPIIDHVRELLEGDFRQGTNHGRVRDRLVALESLLSGNLSEVKERQFRIGYEIERLGGLISAYRSSSDDMPALNAAVLEELDQLHLALKLGIDKLDRWAEFRRMAANDPQREGDADPTMVGEALDEMTAVMERQPKYFDPEVPASFHFLAEAVRDPVGVSKTIVYGSVRSAENLISFLGQKLLGIATKAADAVEEHFSKAVAAFLITSLAGAALQISGALPAGWAWLKPLLDAASKIGGG